MPVSVAKIASCTEALAQTFNKLRQEGFSYDEALSVLIQGLFLRELRAMSKTPADLVKLGGPFAHPAWAGEPPAAVSSLWAQMKGISPTTSELGVSLEALHWSNKSVAERGQGVYYTPPLLAKFMAQLALTLYFRGLARPGSPRRKQAAKLQLPASFVVLDPAVGAGAFLVAALQELMSLPADLRSKRTKCDLLPLLIGQDLDAGAVYLTKVRLWLEVVDEIRDGVSSFPPLPDITVGNSLEGTPLTADIVLINPPYRRQESLDQELKSSLAERFKGQVPRQADLYCYFLANLTEMLKPGGVAAVVTPTAWLEVDYGRAIQTFLQKRLEIPLIIASACERWFQEAAVHTAVSTFVRRTGNRKPRRSTTLVNLLMPLETVEPEQIAALSDSASGFQRCQSWQSVTIPKKRLQALTQKEKPVRAAWGTLLRAPAAYFTLHESTPEAWTRAGELGEVRRGFTSGANNFFFVQDVTAGASDNLRRQLKITPNSGLSVIVASAHGEEAYFAVEERFLLPLIKTPREVDGYLIREESLRWRVLLLPPDKDYIDKLKVARYIRWGEAQGLQQRPTLKARPLWWSLPKLLPPQVLARQFYDRRFNFPYNPGAILCDHTFYYLTGCSDPELIAALLNSTITAFHVELWGRSNMGDGVLTFYGPELDDLPVVKPSLFSADSQESLKTAFRRLCARTVLPIEKEVEQRDRQELDLIVLSALGFTGLTAASLLSEIYTALCRLVDQRQERSRPQFDS